MTSERRWTLVSVPRTASPWLLRKVMTGSMGRMGCTVSGVLKNRKGRDATKGNLSRNCDCDIEDDAKFRTAATAALAYAGASTRTHLKQGNTRMKPHSDWFDGFESRRFEVNGASIQARFSKMALGQPPRPALLLLHGFPQSHVMWHRVAKQLA